MYQFRHGDLLIESVKEIPASATERKNRQHAVNGFVGYRTPEGVVRRFLETFGLASPQPVYRPVSGAVLAEGEATGHAHVIAGGVVLETKDGEVYLRITEDGAVVAHEEHAVVELPKGEFRVSYQREFDPFEQAARQVAD